MLFSLRTPASFFSDDFLCIMRLEAMTRRWKAEVVVELRASATGLPVFSVEFSSFPADWRPFGDVDGMLDLF